MEQITIVLHILQSPFIIFRKAPSEKFQSNGEIFCITIVKRNLKKAL